MLFFQKGVEIVLRNIGRVLPISLSTTYFLASGIVFVLYVYSRQLRYKAKEKVEN